MLQAVRDPEVTVLDILIARWELASDEDREAFVTYLAISGDLNHSPSAAISADTAPVAPSPNPAGAVPFSPDPQNPEVDDGRPHPSANVPSAQNDIGLPGVGQDGSEPCTSNDEFTQQPVGAAQARNEPGSVSGASVTNFSNPRCQHPGTCSHAHLKTSCHDCFLAWAQRPPEEQRRLWTEAEAAAQ